MDYLQYLGELYSYFLVYDNVLNLVIYGWPSIQILNFLEVIFSLISFKPCYIWMTFNTYDEQKVLEEVERLF